MFLHNRVKDGINNTTSSSKLMHSSKFSMMLAKGAAAKISENLKSV